MAAYSPHPPPLHSFLRNVVGFEGGTVISPFLFFPAHSPVASPSKTCRCKRRTRSSLLICFSPHSPSVHHLARCLPNPPPLLSLRRTLIATHRPQLHLHAQSHVSFLTPPVLPLLAQELRGPPIGSFSPFAPTVYFSLWSALKYKNHLCIRWTSTVFPSSRYRPTPPTSLIFIFF